MSLLHRNVVLSSHWCVACISLLVDSVAVVRHRFLLPLGQVEVAVGRRFVASEGELGLEMAGVPSREAVPWLVVEVVVRT
jgi:hypothetical protein